jgi:hypothetical protein
MKVEIVGLAKRSGHITARAAPEPPHAAPRARDRDATAQADSGAVFVFFRHNPLQHGDQRIQPITKDRPDQVQTDFSIAAYAAF